MIEKTTDEIDRASMQEAAFTEASVRDVQKNLAPQKHPDFNGVNCLDCNAEMPLQRLDAGRIRCTDCETLLEEERKQYRRRK